MAVQDTSVRHYISTMPGAPVISGSAGQIIGLLDAVIAGFGTVTINPLTVVGNIATAVVGAGHGFSMLGTTGPVITITGATPVGLNGDWRIKTVTNSTIFTFEVSGISDQTATGTITAKIAGLPLTKVYSSGSVAAFKFNAATPGMRHYLRIDDANALYAVVSQYEIMSDVNTGTGLVPTSGSLYIHKSTATTTNRDWSLFADPYALYLHIKVDGTNWYGAMFWGDVISLVSGDGYNSALMAMTSTTASSITLLYLVSTSGSWISREYTQTGAGVLIQRYSNNVTSILGADGIDYPNNADNGVVLANVAVGNSTKTIIRGTMPGFYNPCHKVQNNGIVVQNVSAFPGRCFYWQRLAGGSCLIDVTGPWR